jgi:hypothetical protein
MAHASSDVRPGFDPAMARKRAECDGTLTGEYIDHGDPPWRWYLMVDLTKKPDGYGWDAVWCESGNIFLIDG